MLIGVPKEIKVHEYRVGLVPAGVRELVQHGHQVIIETNAGAGVGLFDEEYRSAGAEIVGSAKELFERAEMVVKVKEPLESEYTQLSEGQVLFTYLHLAPSPSRPTSRRTWCTTASPTCRARPRAPRPLC